MHEFVLPDYTLYFDTNAAFSPKPDEPMRPRFLEALSELRELTNVDAKAPSVVIQELWYQKTQVALQAAENQRKNAETIKQVSGIVTPRIPDFESLKAGCKQQMENCLTKHSITIVEVPIQKVDWQRIIECACWRVAPFEKPKSNDDLAEKGFRDCLIIEAIVHDAAEIKEGNVAVLSGDRVFTSGLKDRSQSVRRTIELYDGSAAFLSQLRLLSETKSSEFAMTVLEKAGKVFYDPDDPKCVVFAHKLVEKLQADYDEELSKPSILFLLRPDQPTSFSGDWLSEIAEWSPVSDLQMSANHPEFVTVDDQGRYHWKSEITLSRVLKRKHPEHRYHVPISDEKTRRQGVDVLWSAEVDPATAEFSDMRVHELQPRYTDDDFSKPAWDWKNLSPLPEPDQSQ